MLYEIRDYRLFVHLCNIHKDSARTNIELHININRIPSQISFACERSLVKLDMRLITEITNSIVRVHVR
jgi:hypothetical protein